MEENKMKLALTERQIAIHNFLMDTQGEKFTAYQIADTIGIDRKAINALVTGIAKKGYCVREEATSTDAEGKTVAVKYVVLTAEGLNYNHDAAVAHDAEEAEAAKEAKKAARAAAKEADAE
jgi:DNA-binding MarR family transcriptional regulator